MADRFRFNLRKMLIAAGLLAAWLGTLAWANSTSVSGGRLLAYTTVTTVITIPTIILGMFLGRLRSFLVVGLSVSLTAIVAIEVILRVFPTDK
jgi:xanthine/uracil permease